MQKILIISGPTAVGKSDFALELSKFLNMEIISADSIQIYKGLEIATSKPTKEEMNICKHHLVNIISPFDKFNAYDYVKLAKQCVDYIASKGKLPVIVGGTGLYIDSFIKNFDFVSNNQKYLYDFKYIFLDTKREELYKKIDKRVDLWIEKGLVEEVKMLRAIGINSDYQCMQAIGYKELNTYFDNESVNLDEIISLIKKNTRNYAKRQITWFKNNKLSIEVQMSQKNDLINSLIENYSEYKK